MNIPPKPPAAPRFPHSLSVFFPAYNDAKSLPALIARTFEVLQDRVADFEVIAVNDGSVDETGQVLEALQARHGERLRVVTHATNRGYGGALRSGFESSIKEFVFYTDGDGQYDVGELPLLLEAVAPGVGLVNGWKLRRHDPRHRIWIGRVYNAFARTLFRSRLRDSDCDFRLCRRALVGRSPLTATSGTVCVELVKRLELSGARVVELPVHHYPRLHGRSQFFRVRSLLVTLCQLISLYWTTVLAPGRPMLDKTEFVEWTGAGRASDAD